jgi:3-methylcrotonyl-CoA carboxylase alpha subunit
MSDELRCGDVKLAPRVKRLVDGALAVVLDGREHRVENARFQAGVLCFEYAGRRYAFHALTSPGEVLVADGAAVHRFVRQEPGIGVEPQANGHALTSQMPGKVLKLLCAPGQRVERGTPLLILEAMKMEHEICAPSAGVVNSYPCAEGGRVMPGSLLVCFSAQDG